MQRRWSGEWHIVDTQTGLSLESHEREKNARYFCQAVNEHEKTNGRPERYAVEHHSESWRSRNV